MLYLYTVMVWIENEFVEYASFEHICDAIRHKGALSSDGRYATISLVS